MAPSPPPPPPPPPESDSIIDGLGLSNGSEGAVALPNFTSGEQNGLSTEAPEPPPVEKKPWEKPLPIPEIRKSSTNWSLASDAGLLLYLQEFSQRMIAKTSQLEKEVDGLVNTAKSASTKVHNTFNDFLMLANTQFIENRVYDDSEEVEVNDTDEKDSKKDPQSKSREQREAEVIPRVIKALTLGVNVLDTAFEQLDANAGNSDSEDEEATYKSVDPILEPKDLYAHRSLPYIIGTPAFMQDDDVGLADLVSEEEEEESSSEEEESDLSESDYSVTESDDDDEPPARKKSSVSAGTGKSGDSGDEKESDGDLFGSGRGESDSEGSDEEKAATKPKGNVFASELAAKIGAAPPSAEDDETETKKERSVSEVSQGSSKPSKKESKKKKKSKKHRSGSAVEKSEDDNLFSQPDPEDEDSPFGRKGLFSTTGGGLFDDEDDGDKDGGLFDEEPTVTKTDHIYEAVNDEAPKQTKAKKQKKEKAESSGGLFDDDVDDLFGSSGPTKEEPKKSKAPSKSEGSGGLFADDDDDLFGIPEKKETKQEKKAKAPAVDLFGEDEGEEGDLFGDSTYSEPPREKEEKPQKKLPAGAVPIFGNISPLANRRPPSSSSDDDRDDFEEPPLMESQPNSESRSVNKEEKAKPAASEAKPKVKDDPFADDDDDELFSTPKEEAKTKPKSRTAESLFDDLEEEGTEDDLFAATAKSKEPTKKKPVGGVALFGGADIFGSSKVKDEEEEDEKEKETAEEPAPQKKSQNRNKANTLSLFNDDPLGGDDGESDLFSAPTKKKEEETEDKGARRRTKSKSIFADEDVLFGTNEDDPSVDLFGSTSPTKPTQPESPTSSPKETSVPKSKPRSSSSRGLFSDEDEDDLFGGGPVTDKPKDKPKEKPKKVEKKVEDKKKKAGGGGRGLFGDEDDDEDDLFGENGSKGEAKAGDEDEVDKVIAEEKPEPTKHKKLAGAVSMFGGIDPSTIVKKKSSSSFSESDKEPTSPSSPAPLSTDQSKQESSSSKSSLHDKPPPIASPKPSKAPAKSQAKPVVVPKKPVQSSPTESPKSPATSSKIGALQASLAIDPSALKPGAARPVKEDAPLEVGFDVPVSTNTLTSLQKRRPRPTGKRRLPSRKSLQAKASQSDQSLFGETENNSNLQGAVGGIDIPDSSFDFDLPEPSPPSSINKSPSGWKPVRAPASNAKSKTSDLFGNDDLFGDVSSTPADDLDFSSGSKPKSKTESKTESNLFSDSFKTPLDDPLSLGTSGGTDGTDKLGGTSIDADISKSKEKSPKGPLDDDEDDLFGEEHSFKTTLKTDSALMGGDDDLFGENSLAKTTPVSPSLDVDEDLFASSSISPPPKDNSVLEDDDLFGDTSGAKPKKKTKKPAVVDDNDDLFAEKPAASKKTKGKKVKPDSDLFGDSTDIFADLPASKPKKKGAKKDSDIFKSTGDDIFSSDSSGTPTKTKKKAKKKTDKKKVADSIFDTSAPSIFDDPLNATKPD